MSNASNSAAGYVSVLLGNGDGTLQAPLNAAVGRDPHAMVVGDFNGDGNPDLAVANKLDDTVSILLGNEDGTFQAQRVYRVGSYPTHLATGDFNGHGRLDIAVAVSDSNS